MNNTNTYIISLEAKDVLRAQYCNSEYISKDNINLFKGALDYSLEAIKINEIDNNQFYMIKDKQYTKAVVNLTFKYAIDELEYIDNNNMKHVLALTTNQIRDELYNNGFILDGHKYVRFKRSSGASRVGKCLFIKESLYYKMMEWSYMGLEYGEKDQMDLASMEAYIALTTSSIIDTINIDSKSILLIDDYESIFKDKVMGTKMLEDGSLTTQEEVVSISNSIWDGQSILDISCFGKYQTKGFLLLRNRFFKSACFNGNIQQFFKDNKITSIDDINGITFAKRIEDIKMITTPSSIKYLKFKSHKIFNGDKEKCFKYWANNVESMFGVVKYEKEPKNLHGMVQTHYQLINTLPLSKNEMKELLRPTLQYIDLLKNNLSVLRNHIGVDYRTALNSNGVISCNFNNTSNVIYNLMMLNDKFTDTKLFYDYKQDIIQSFKENVRKGHILVNGNYSVLCGNGLEMLKATIKDRNHPMSFKGESILGIDEIHSKKFEYNINLLGCRSPHVTMGNILICINVECLLLDRYFNSTKEIVHVNSIDNNLLERLSSADFDSDQILLTDDETLVRSASEIYNTFLVPTDLTEKKVTSRTNSVSDKLDLDIKTSKNKIGEIINMSQILNSEYWDRKAKNTDVTGLYELISQLDVLSCIEIDRAKKESMVNSDLELKKLRNSKWIKKKIHIVKSNIINKEDIRRHFTRIINGELRYFVNLKNNKIKEVLLEKDQCVAIKRKTVLERPYFFKFVGEGKNYDFVKKETPMDYLENEIDRIKKGKNRKETRFESLTNLLVENIDKTKANRHQINKIINKINIINKEINGVWKSNNLTNNEKYEISKRKKDLIIEIIKRVKVSRETICTIIYRLGNEYSRKSGNLTKMGRLLLSVLYEAHTEIFLSVFKLSKNKIKVLDKYEIDDNEVIDIYGEKYTEKFTF